jgi:hypothetical protein
MTLKRVQKSRRMIDELPVAKLYLDDVREIVNIMSLKDSDSTTRDPQVTYRVGEFQCNTLEELEKIGGTARDFEIVVLNQGRRSYLHIDGAFTFLNVSGPEIDSSFRREKIREIFDVNSIWWKQIIRQAFERIPFWFLAVVFLVSSTMSHFDPRPVNYRSFWIPAAVLVLVGYIVLGRGSVVRLCYAHASSPKKWIREHATQIAFLILSAVLGAFAKEMITPVTNWIAHFWR